MVEAQHQNQDEMHNIYTQQSLLSHPLHHVRFQVLLLVLQVPLSITFVHILDVAPIALLIFFKLICCKIDLFDVHCYEF